MEKGKLDTPDKLTEYYMDEATCDVWYKKYNECSEKELKKTIYSKKKMQVCNNILD